MSKRDVFVELCAWALVAGSVAFVFAVIRKFGGMP